MSPRASKINGTDALESIELFRRAATSRHCSSTSRQLSSRTSLCIASWSGAKSYSKWSSEPCSGVGEIGARPGAERIAAPRMV